ncbi:MAG TPA: hypothetical protein VLV85_18590, partial [Stellaceae bacterium]|nr:hypothetical protein [Stellaceae bacterium]
DHVLLDGKPPPGLAPGVPSLSLAKLALPAEPEQTVIAVFDHERIAARDWPMKDDQVSVVEFTW